MSHGRYGAPSELFGRIQLVGRRWEPVGTGSEGRRASSQDDPIHGRCTGQLQSRARPVIAQMSLGTGALVMVGGTVVIVACWCWPPEPSPGNRLGHAAKGGHRSLDGLRLGVHSTCASWRH